MQLTFCIGEKRVIRVKSLKTNDNQECGALQEAETKHLYVEINPKICDGSSVINGTRIRVVDIAIKYEYLNHTPDEIINAHPHLKLEQIHDALSYYYENEQNSTKK